MQLPLSSASLSVISQLASQPSLRPSSDTQSHCSSQYCSLVSNLYIVAPTGITPAAITDCRLAQPVTPETVYSPTLAGRLVLSVLNTFSCKPRNLILCLTRAGFEPMTSNTAFQRLTTVPTRQAVSGVMDVQISI